MSSHFFQVQGSVKSNKKHTVYTVYTTFVERKITLFPDSCYAYNVPAITLKTMPDCIRVTCMFPVERCLDG